MKLGRRARERLLALPERDRLMRQRACLLAVGRWAREQDAQANIMLNSVAIKQEMTFDLVAGPRTMMMPRHTYEILEINGFAFSARGTVGRKEIEREEIAQPNVDPLYHTLFPTPMRSIEECWDDIAKGRSTVERLYSALLLDEMETQVPAVQASKRGPRL